MQASEAEVFRTAPRGIQEGAVLIARRAFLLKDVVGDYSTIGTLTTRPVANSVM